MFSIFTITVDVSFYRQCVRICMSCSKQIQLLKPLNMTTVVCVSIGYCFPPRRVISHVLYVYLTSTTTYQSLYVFYVHDHYGCLYLPSMCQNSYVLYVYLTSTYQSLCVLCVHDHCGYLYLTSMCQNSYVLYVYLE